MDLDCFTSCARGWLPCPLQSKKKARRQNLLPYTVTDFNTWFIFWLRDKPYWTLDCSCFDYGPRLLHIMRQGLASLPAAKQKEGKEVKPRALPSHGLQDVLHRLAR